MELITSKSPVRPSNKLPNNHLPELTLQQYNIAWNRCGGHFLLPEGYRIKRPRIVSYLDVRPDDLSAFGKFVLRPKN